MSMIFDMFVGLCIMALVIVVLGSLAFFIAFIAEMIDTYHEIHKEKRQNNV